MSLTWNTSYWTREPVPHDSYQYRRPTDARAGAAAAARDLAESKSCALLGITVPPSKARDVQKKLKSLVNPLTKTSTRERLEKTSLQRNYQSLALLQQDGSIVRLLMNGNPAAYVIYKEKRKKSRASKLSSI